MTVALIDDQLLGQVIRGETPRALAGKELFTTGYWYVRLCRAVLGAHERAGVLSRPFVGLPPALRERATGTLLELPPAIGLLSVRALAPTMATLRQRHELNVLSIEALAAATRLQAQVHLSAASPRLEAALRHENLKVKLPRPK